jgi:hypothetical protein
MFVVDAMQQWGLARANFSVSVPGGSALSSSGAISKSSGEFSIAG